MGRDSPKTEGVLTTNPSGRKSSFQRPAPRTHTSNNQGATSEDGASIIARPTRTTHTHRHQQSDSSIPRILTSPSPSLGSDLSSIIFSTPKHSVATTRDSRIPRPKSTVPESTKSPSKPQASPDPLSPMREPMSLNAAFRRAQQQTAGEKESDSDNTIDLRQAFNMANAEFNGTRGVDGSPSPAPRSFRQGYYNAVPKTGAGRTNGDLDNHLKKFDRNHQLSGASNPLDGLFTKNPVGTKVSETGRALAKRASSGSLDRNPEQSPSPGKQETRPHNSNPTEVSRRASRGEVTASRTSAAAADVPVPSIEYESASDDQSSVNSKAGNLSPNKNANWQLEADFTAGDLQVSDSPRVRLGLDRENPRAETARNVRNSPARQQKLQQSNDRLSRLQEREAEAAKTTVSEETRSRSQQNRRLDEIRAREMEALSKRAVASSRLDEIRVRNSESPESFRQYDTARSKEGLAPASDADSNAKPPKLDTKPQGELIPNTPVVVYKNPGTRKGRDGDSNENTEKETKREPLTRNDSHDLLRRLARATSSSPPAEKSEGSKATDSKKIPSERSSGANSPHRVPLSREENKVKNLEIKNPRERLSVGFADLRRNISSDSMQEKRSSMPLSDMDPTDRIAAELNLFAPLDNYSEKGSIRAPSPVSSEPIEEETPRPIKTDPMMMPTPRVTGAYVETPATVRAKDEERDSAASLHLNGGPTKIMAKGRARSSKRTGSRSSSAPTGLRRSRSSSRRRHPLINTAKPPTVREDILAILRAYEIDDSTLENLDCILASKEAEDHELERMVNDSVLKVEQDLDFKFTQAPDRDRELEAYDRMSKSLKTGLLGIRSAKKGIERLEDKVNLSDSKGKHPETPDTIITKPTPLAAIDLIIPKYPLFRKNPFRLTTLGILAMVAALWVALEYTFTLLYVPPRYPCTPLVPCEWSPNEPYFPYAMPFMLDEWATGGKGRALAFWIGEEVGDVAADVSDWVTNTDFTQFDERYMNVWERKRHRRRLRKRELVPVWTPPADYQLKFPEWFSIKSAREAAHDVEYDVEDETIGADEVVR